MKIWRRPTLLGSANPCTYKIFIALEYINVGIYSEEERNTRYLKQPTSETCDDVKDLVATSILIVLELKRDLGI